MEKGLLCCASQRVRAAALSENTGTRDSDDLISSDRKAGGPGQIVASSRSRFLTQMQFPTHRSRADRVRPAGFSVTASSLAADILVSAHATAAPSLNECPRSGLTDNSNS